ncbi:MAG: histone deacetylase family protein [Alphaproteobacteria bacterium]
MKIVYSPKHVRHHGRGELNDGEIQPCNERPERALTVKAALEAAGFADWTEPPVHSLAALERVHSPDFLAFLERCWTDWLAEHGDADGNAPDALPLIWPVRSLRAVRPEHIDGIISYYAMDAGTPIGPGTWEAVTHAAFCALTAVDLVSKGARAVFSLARPPGHHAAGDVYGGYCFLNNAAIAAQAFRDAGASRVAVLDVDYHHGNGTQAIFYGRGDVLVVNVHADPRWEFPYFLGHADETGAGAGEGATVNLPLPFGTDWAGYAPALDAACDTVSAFAPDALVVSFGFDTYEGDPISRFRLKTEDFAPLGARLAGLRLPTAIIMEGGYAVDALGTNVVRALTGFNNG